MNVGASFGAWLKRRRKTLDLTQEALAEQVGCSVATIQKIEADERRPSRQMAGLLAQHLSIPADERAIFLKVARGELRTDRLAEAAQTIVITRPTAAPRPVSNLPVPATPLVGREAELAALAQLLCDPHCRLLTLVGPGGVGKTRLAIEAADRYRAAHDGVYFVPLDSISSAAFIVPAIAHALSLSFQGNQAPQTQLLNHLQTQHLLLILDNFEHVLDGAPLVVEMLSRARDIQLVITSREPLNLQGEWLFDVHGLPVPDTFAAGIELNSAVSLFVQAAQRACSGYMLSAEDRAAVARICQLVDGLPLALELAAGWIRLLTCREIAHEIEHSLDVLAAQRRAAPERHRSVQAVFDHSWKLLSAEEQRGLRQLAVFRGGFTRDMARQVAGTDLALLSALLAKSLVQRNGEKRYRLHELVRQYGLAQLQLAGEDAQTRSAHLLAFIQLAEAAEPHLTQSDQVHWLMELGSEHDNFRDALAWALDSTDTASSLRLAAALWRFWHVRCHFAEGNQWVERILQASPAAFPALRARVLKGAGFLAIDQTRYEQAIRWFEECLALRAYLSEYDIAHAQLGLASVLEEQSNFTRAWNLCEESLRHFRRIDDETGISFVLHQQALLAHSMGDAPAADRLFDEALALARKRADARTTAWVLISMGWVAGWRHDQAVLTRCGEALVLSCELSSKVGVAFCLEGIGSGLAANGQAAQAACLFGAASALREAIDAPLSPLNVRWLEAMIQPARNFLSEAAFASAWTEGRSWSMEQAIARALAACPLAPLPIKAAANDSGPSSGK
jgi:predicted ATPase/DNA-binding XRE family transcriptional regulator